jgi:hypothetical protein
MGFKVVKPDELSIKPTESSYPVLPREEGRRMRRSSREMADSMLPEAMRVLMKAFESDKMEDNKWAADKVFKMTLAAVPNETVDPETVVIDGSVTSKDALQALEEETEKGTGLPDE